MRTPPKLTEYARYPVIAGVAVLAVAVTIARWAGVNENPLLATAMVRRGELWRLLTDILPHGDILHLAFDVYWFWVFGSLVEEVFGHWKTAALLVFFAVGSSAMEFAFLDGGIGLSGVVYGLFGLLWVLSERDPSRFHDAVDKPTIQIFVAWFIFCIVATWLHFMAVANLAHAAGLGLGILLGLALTLEDERKWAVAGGAAGVFVVVLLLATVARPWVNVSRRGGIEEGRWGYEALESGHAQEAEAWLRDAVRYQPREPLLWFDLGVAEHRLGKDAEAHDAFQRAHELDPSDPNYGAMADMTR